MEKINLEKLRSHFNPKDIDWRIGQVGHQKNGNPWATGLAYVNARAIMDRLDEEVGPGNWKDSYEHLDDGVLCRLSIKVDGEWITKEDGSPETQIEAFKGGFSKALVRCAVKWGIGRYLYNLPKVYVNIVPQGTNGANFASGEVKKTKKKYAFLWMDPDISKYIKPPQQKDPPKNGAAERYFENNENEAGGRRLHLGKNAGRIISEVETEKLNGYLGWLQEKKFLEDGKFTKYMSNDLQNIAEFLGEEPC